RTRIRGKRSWYCRGTAGRTYCTVETMHARVTSPPRFAATSRTPSRMASRSSSSVRALRAKSRPTAVSSTLRVSRSNRRTPSASSSLSMRLLNAGCERWIVSAAARKLASSATAMKARRSPKSKFMLMAHQSYGYLQFTVYRIASTIRSPGNRRSKKALSEVSKARYSRAPFSVQPGTFEGGVVKLSKLYRALYFQVLVGLALGIAVGHYWPDFGASLKPLGDGFVKLVKMMIAPVVFCTIVLGITSLNDGKEIGKTLVKSMALFYVLTILALVIGLAAVLVMQPGAGMNIDPATLDPSVAKRFANNAAPKGFAEFVLHIIPNSFFVA